MRIKINPFIIFITIFLIIYCSNDNDVIYPPVFKIFDNDMVGVPKWTPDCNKIAFVYFRNGDYDLLCYIDREGGHFYTINMTRYFSFIPSYSISPDGNYIAFEESEWDDYTYSSLYLIPAEGGEPFLLVDSDNEYQYNTSPTFSPDGDFIYFIRWSVGQYNNDSIWKIRPDGSNLSKVGIDTTNLGSLNQIQCSNDGNYLLINYAYGIFEFIHTTIISSIDGEKRWSIADNTDFNNSGGCYTPCFSPDDKWVCFSHEGDLWIVPSDNSQYPVRITNFLDDNPSCKCPDWSSDGQWIVFFRNYDGIYKLEVPYDFLPE